MKAAVWIERRRVELQDVPDPQPSPHEALIRVLRVGLCGSDLEEYESGPIVATPGTILGHEIVGEVVIPASDGSGPPAGTRVVVDVVRGCGQCWWCDRHEEGLCQSLSVLGQTTDGGLAELLAANASRLIPVPDRLTSRHAALAEPLAVAVRALRKAERVLGASVVIYGGGTIGMLTAQVAVRSGASTVIVVEPDEGRRELISQWSAGTVWGDSEDSRLGQLAAMLPQRGADIVIECSGRSGVAREAALATRRGGLLILLGVPVHDENLDLLDVVLGEKRIVGSAAHMWDDDVAVAVQMLADRKVTVEPLITHESPLGRVDNAFALLGDRSSGVVKLLIDCTNVEGGTKP